jgi:hypothetical protein
VIWFPEVRGFGSTKVLLQVGLAEEQSAVVRYQQLFQLTNKSELKFLSSSFK